MIFFDIIILSFSLWLSFVLKVGDRESVDWLLWPKDYILNFWLGFVLIPSISIPLFIKFGLYRSVLRYLGYKVILSCFQAITIATAMSGFILFLFRD